MKAFFGAFFALVGVSAMAQLAPLYIVDRLSAASGNPGNDRILVYDRSDVTIFFDENNTAGTPGLPTITSLTAAPDGTLYMGENTLRVVVWAKDKNNDGDAQDSNESGIFYDNTNAANISIVSPVGVAVGPDGSVYIASANNGGTFGTINDLVVRAKDTSGDGDALDQDEQILFFNGFDQSSTGASSPFKLVVDPRGIVYVSDMGTAKTIRRLEDKTGDGDADDSDEASVYFSNANQSGLTISAIQGIAFTPDGGFYFLDTAGTDKIYRAKDTGRNGDANEANEVSSVWLENLSGQSTLLIDLIVNFDGSLLVSDTTNKRLLLLSDTICNGNYNDTGETTIALTSALFTNPRQLAYGPLTEPVTLTGKVTIEGLTNLNGAKVVFEFRNPACKQLVQQRIVNLDANGSYSISGLPKLPFNIKLSANKTLTNAADVNLATTATKDWTLYLGDTNRDNKIDDFDLANVIFDFGNPPSGNNGDSDLTGDDMVDDFDLAVVIFNFGKVGIE